MNTRKKVIKTVYKDEDDSENDVGDFSGSESDAHISEKSESTDDNLPGASAEESDFENNKSLSKNKKAKKRITHSKPKAKFTKSLLNKLYKQSSTPSDDENVDSPTAFSVKDLTDADKLLPSVLNLSESDSSEDEVSNLQSRSKGSPSKPSTSAHALNDSSGSENETMAYTDVWSKPVEDNSEEIAKHSFKSLEQHTNKIKEAKATLQQYTVRQQKESEANVKDLLAMGEEVSDVKEGDAEQFAHTSESELEDWEEVKVSETKSIPQSGIQLIVDFPGATTKKSKELDVEMMMKRKINRVKREYQVFMHKVHVLCWLGHGNFVSSVLNDQEIMAGALSLVPSQQCYPSERVDIKYLEQVTKWYRDKMKVKLDKNENKFKPNQPPLKQILLKQISTATVNSNKFLVYIFISMLRALGIQCRIMINFVTLPKRPLSSELCSLSTKPKQQTESKQNKPDKKTLNKKSQPKKAVKKISQLDGNDDEFSMEVDNENFGCLIISQLDGNDDEVKISSKTTVKKANPLALKSSSKKSSKVKHTHDKNLEEDVSPPKRPKNTSKLEAADLTSTNTQPAIEIISQSENKYSSKSRKPKVCKSSNTQEKETRDVGKASINTEDSGIGEQVMSKRKSLKLKPQSNSQKSVPSKNINESHNSNANKNVVKSPDEITNQTSKLRKRENPISKKKILANDNKGNDLEPNNLSDTKEIVKKTRSSQKKENTSINSSTKLTKHEVVTVKPDQTVEQCDSNNSINNSKTDSDPNRRTNHKSRLSTKRACKTNKNEESQIQPINKNVSSCFFKDTSPSTSKVQDKIINKSQNSPRSKTMNSPGPSVKKSKYFDKSTVHSRQDKKRLSLSIKKKENPDNDGERVSHRDLLAKKSSKVTKNDVTKDLVKLIKGRVREAKTETKQNIVKGKIKKDSDDDSDYLPEEGPKPKGRGSESDNDFKPTKISPKSRIKKLDRRVLSPDEDSVKRRIGVDVWCEVYVEEEEQWIAVDIVKGQVHCVNEIYGRATHPVAYVVGWDNSNYLKDLTQRYVPHWNTVTRKLRAEPDWWQKAIKPWLGPRTPKDRLEDEQLDKMQLDAPLPKSISEYKNHPLYALKRHLLKFEVIYPADAATLGFVRGEPVYARACVHTCRSRDTWLKEAKTVRPGETPYKVVKARPKWDKLSNKVITDILLEVFGPWQVQDYEPPTAENGIVPRNAYGNVELFKDCMLPKGTVHIKLPGLNKVARKLNIDCASAMTGFDFHGGWTHPVFDGFVVCKEFEEILTDAWVKEEEEIERKEQEKMEARVYGNWKKLIKGLLIRRRLVEKYSFEQLDATKVGSKKKPSKGPRLVIKKNK